MNSLFVAATAPRSADGNLPKIGLRLAAGSHLIDAGTNVGLPYVGAAPDLGAFESPEPGGQQYPGAIACWKMDETEGHTAYDSIGVFNGVLNGASGWKPAGGMIGGALELDGINDYVSTPFVLNPAAGAFSVFAWVKGGSPGQVVLSQQSGVNWLMAADPNGALGTELKLSGRLGVPLVSTAVITDGAWYHIGFAWDGAGRILYVDDVEVARDTHTSLVGANTGLHIGTGSNAAAGSFWSGLIDDVRIYNRAVNP